MNNLFSSSGFTAQERVALTDGSVLNLKTLPRFLRVLLTTDGTVTKSLESYFWEPVTVQLVEQGLEIVDTRFPYLDVDEGDALLKRQVELVGVNSHHIYLLADSYIQLSSLPERLSEDLLGHRLGIGELLRECGLETYRELLDFGVIDVPQLGRSLWRTYRIMLAGRPCIQITEHFPLALYNV